MKTTIELPDALITEVKIEAARQKKKLKELVPELLRAGLRSRSSSRPSRQDAERWLEEWVALGRDAIQGLPEADSVETPTASQVLAIDRGRLDRD